MHPNCNLEGDTLFVRCTGRLTLNDIEQYVTRFTQIAAATPVCHIHILMDMRELISFPQQHLLLHRLLKPVLRHPKCGWLLVYEPISPIVHRDLSIVANASQNLLRFFPTRDEAFAFLEHLHAPAALT